MTRPALVLCGAAALIAAYLAGMSQAPTREHWETKVLRVEVAAKETAHKEQAAASSAGVVLQGPVITRWRTPPAPGCPEPTFVERIEGAREERHEAASTSSASSASREVTASQEARQEVRTGERKSPRFSLGLDGSIRFHEEPVELVFRGRGEIKPLAGLPFWIGAVAEPQTKRYGITGRVEW